ncbi:MAG: hypothetical protein KBT35_01255 [Firmicutes bacterium]|nr:hypothetical protein [Candidatus Colivicinus equi]
MPLKPMPTHKAPKNLMLEIPNPGIGGLNLFDLEYEQEVNQSPYMMNMMYKNGTFSKRYGQSIDQEYSGKIYCVTYFDGKLFVHAGKYVYCDGTVISQPVSETMGRFIKFSYSLFYFCGNKVYVYKKNDSAEWTWGEAESYIPDVLINCRPSASTEEGIPNFEYQEQINLLSLKFNEIYNGDGVSTTYSVWGDDEDMIDWNIVPTITIDEVPTTAFTVDKANKQIKFNSAPPEGNLNVVVTMTLKESWLAQDRNRLLASKYSIAYGSNGNSRLFLAGGGDSKYFYSESYDPTYFPENNWEILGSTENDITGFGLQYNVLLVLKPKEIFSIYSYQITASMVKAGEEDLIGTEAFTSTIVNSEVGCDCPNTIQLINNQLTWLNSKEGVCTLVSTNVVDERNVRVISRNINHSNSGKIKGILDYKEDLEKINSIDYDSKYFICFPESGYCYMWDYAISPYSYTSSKTTEPKSLDWFIFNNFYVKKFVKAGLKLIYCTDNGLFDNCIIELNDSFEDLDFDKDGKADGISAYYMTPFLQFNAVEYLKTVRNIYVQCRGDTISNIDIYYFTDGSLEPEKEPLSIRIEGKIWSHFSWLDFGWRVINLTNVFRRKCSLKRIQMVAFYFESVDVYEGGELVFPCVGRDMSISHIGIDYQIIRTVK